MSFFTNLFHAFAAAGSAFILVFTGGAPAEAPVPSEATQIDVSTSPSKTAERPTETKSNSSTKGTTQPSPKPATVIETPTTKQDTCTDKSYLTVRADKTDVFSPTLSHGYISSTDSILFSMSVFPGCDFDAKGTVTILEDGKLLKNISLPSSDDSYTNDIAGFYYEFTPLDKIPHATHIDHVLTFRYLTSEESITIRVAGS